MSKAFIVETNRLSSVVANAAFQMSEKEAVKERTLTTSANKLVKVSAGRHCPLSGSVSYRVTVDGFALSAGVNEHREDERIVLIDIAKKFLESIKNSLIERENVLTALSEVARQERKDIECSYTTFIEVQI